MASHYTRDESNPMKTNRTMAVLFALAALGLAGTVAGQGRSSPKNAVATPQLAVFGVPVGASMAEVKAMGKARGYRMEARPGYCSDAELCTRLVNIENLPGTEFISSIRGHRKFADREESFRFAFTARPGDMRVWSAGSDQRFGDRYRPSAAAPLLNDVLAELRQRFGEPAVLLDGGGQLMSGSRRPLHKIYWLWDDKGRPVRWTKAMWNTCVHAIGMAAVPPGSGHSSQDNPVGTDPRPFLLARQGGCAAAVSVELGHQKGLVHGLQVRVVDFRAGHDAQYHTNQLLKKLRAESSAVRSRQNRPDF